MDCSICKTEMDIVASSSIKKMINNMVWRHETISCVAKSKIKLIESKYTPEELNKKYHIYVCKGCGNGFDGIKNIRKYI